MGLSIAYHLPELAHLHGGSQYMQDMLTLQPSLLLLFLQLVTLDELILQDTIALLVLAA